MLCVSAVGVVKYFIAMHRNIIEKLRNANLLGRGGAAFPAWQKWEAVKNGHGGKYVVANGSEGEPGVFKDGYILEHYAEEFLNGLKIAVEFLSAKEAVIYLNHDYYKKFKEKLQNLAGDLPIRVLRNTALILGERRRLCLIL